MIKFLFFIITLTINLLHSSDEFDWMSYYPTVQNDVKKIRRLKKPVVISLGSTCSPSYMSQVCGLRTYSFPNDWNWTPFSSLVKLLENDYYNFFNYEYFTITDYGVMHIDYGIVLPHLRLDLKNWALNENGTTVALNEIAMQEYITEKEKFSRRVARMYSVLSTSLPVYFLRHGAITIDEAHQLYNLLHQKFPDANFTLICISYYEDDGVCYQESPFYFFPKEKDDEFSNRDEYIKYIIKHYIKNTKDRALF
ncbi:MAG: hypothetical protein FJZ56_02165 [Chlamydiae bacterium]|nr:hypothetical protein [Chlamydiota bacterium]